MNKNTCPHCGKECTDPHNKWLGPDGKQWYCLFSHLPEEYQKEIKQKNQGNPFIDKDDVHSAFNLAIGVAKQMAYFKEKGGEW